MSHRCEEQQEQILDYLYDELGAPERAALEAIFDACPRCAAELEALGGVRTLMQALPPESPARGPELILQTAAREARLRGEGPGALSRLGAWLMARPVLTAGALVGAVALSWAGQRLLDGSVGGGQAEPSAELPRAAEPPPALVGRPSDPSQPEGEASGDALAPKDAASGEVEGGAPVAPAATAAARAQGAKREREKAAPKALARRRAVRRAKVGALAAEGEPPPPGEGFGGLFEGEALGDEAGGDEAGGGALAGDPLSQPGLAGDLGVSSGASRGGGATSLAKKAAAPSKARAKVQSESRAPVATPTPPPRPERKRKAPAAPSFAEARAEAPAAAPAEAADLEEAVVTGALIATEDGRAEADRDAEGPSRVSLERALRAGLCAAARDDLRAISGQLSSEARAQAHLRVGRCFEGLGALAQAERAYQAARGGAPAEATQRLQALRARTARGAASEQLLDAVDEAAEAEEAVPATTSDR